MRILILTQLFHPEPNHLKGLAYAQELVRRGHEVEILTCFPNYPGGTIYPGYHMKPWTSEIISGIRVHRVMMFPSHDRSAVRRSMGYASFAVSAALIGPWLVRKPDLVHVYQGPATLGWPALALESLRGAPFVLDIQDLWPDSVVASDMVRIPGVEPLLALWSKLTYRLARKVIVLSKGYRDSLLRRGVPADKIEVVPNWCDERASEEPAKPFGGDPFGLRGAFNIVYAGNFGVVQNLGNVIEAAGLISEKRPEVRFVMIGSGVEEPSLREAVSRRGLKNVLFVPRQVPDKLGALMAFADVILVHLRDDPLAAIGIPQKTQAALAAGKPILMAARGSAGDLIREAEAGLVCAPGRPSEVAAAATKLADLPREELRAMGLRGRSYYQRELSFSIGVRRMIEVYESALLRPRRDPGFHLPPVPIREAPLRQPIEPCRATWMIRPAEARDVDALARLHCHSFRPQEHVPVLFGERYVRSVYRWFVTSRRSYVLAVESEGRLIGVVAVSDGPYVRRMFAACWPEMLRSLVRKPLLPMQAGLWRRLFRSSPSAGARPGPGDRLGSAHLAFIAVDRAFRGRGIFRDLISASEATSRARGSLAIRAGVYKMNGSSRRAFSKAGWTEVPGLETADTVFYGADLVPRNPDA
jgi:colanic acid biosynthesis glycosyl transferase WcaI